jgi:hypothetical protein
MSQSSTFEEANEDLKQLRKSKISLAEALGRLDSISAAMERALRLEKQVENLTHSVDELTALAHDTLSRAFFASFMDRVGIELEVKINKLFETHQGHFEDLLSQKVSTEDLYEKLREKASLAQFGTLKDMLAKQQEKLENFIYWKFEPFSEKMKERINDKAAKEDVTRIESKLYPIEFITKICDQMQAMQSQMNNLLESDNEEEEEDDVSVEGLFSKVEKQLDERDFKSVTSTDGRSLSHSPSGTNQPSSRTDYPSIRNSQLLSKQSTIGKKKTLGGVGRQVDRLQNEFINMFRESENLRSSINQTVNLHQEKLGDLHKLTKDIDDRTIKMIDDWSDVQKSRKEVELLKTETQKNTKDALSTVHRLLHDFNDKESEKLKRIKKLEIASEIHAKDLEKLRTIQKEKINECIKAIHSLNNQHENSLKDYKNFLDEYSKFQADLEQELNEVKNEIFSVKGPLTSLVTHKFIENEVLCEDIKRQQDVFRSLLDDYANSIEKQKMNPPSSISTRESVQKYYEHMRLKKENVKLRASSFTPSNIHRPNTAASQFGRRSAFSRSDADHEVNVSMPVTRLGNHGSNRPSRQGSSQNTSRDTTRLKIRDSGSVLSIK